MSVPLRPQAGTFWLETDPTDKLTVPTRAILFDPAMAKWSAPWLPGIRDAATLMTATARVPGRKISHGKHLAADVHIAASEDGLLPSGRPAPSTSRSTAGVDSPEPSS